MMRGARYSGRQTIPRRGTALGRRPGGAVASVALLAGACSFAPSPEMPETVVEMPGTYAADADIADHEPLEWWRSFRDPTLDRLVETALVANLDLREAVARLEELRHRYRIARAPLLPSITLNADVTESSSPGNTGLGGSFGGEDDEPADSAAAPLFVLPDRFAFTTYSASLGFAYEVDFWGRLRNETSASIYDFLASRADLETVRLTVIGSTISTYLEVVALRRQLGLAEENVDLLRERSELTEERYRAGLTNS
ncbi:MAG: TolC family protein, partial [Gemmatimonadetes bacterium]|nr:TolC family protein [Gemmatimonadota bacterium]